MPFFSMADSLPSEKQRELIDSCRTWASINESNCDRAEKKATEEVYGKKLSMQYARQGSNGALNAADQTQEFTAFSTQQLAQAAQSCQTSLRSCHQSCGNDENQEFSGVVLLPGYEDDRQKIESQYCGRIETTIANLDSTTDSSAQTFIAAAQAADAIQQRDPSAVEETPPRECDGSPQNPCAFQKIIHNITERMGTDIVDRALSSR